MKTEQKILSFSGNDRQACPDWSRRRFAAGIGPLCTALCLALPGAGLLGQGKPSQDKPLAGHKFDQPLGRRLTLRQEMELQYTAHFIPYLQILEQELGKEKVLASLRKFSYWEAREYARDVIKTRGKNDLSIFKEDYNPSTPQLTTDILEDSANVWAIRITECLWAKIWIDAGAADLGVAAVCDGDIPFASFVNPLIQLDLDGTIMGGKPRCILRYHYI